MRVYRVGNMVKTSTNMHGRGTSYKTFITLQYPPSREETKPSDTSCPSSSPSPPSHTSPPPLHTNTSNSSPKLLIHRDQRTTTMTTTYILPHLPPHKIHITHLPSLSPAAFKTFQQELTSPNTTPSNEYAFLDASAILSTTHLLAAVFQAVRNELVSGKRRTRNVHSEVVYCLGGNNNVCFFALLCWRERRVGGWADRNVGGVD